MLLIHGTDDEWVPPGQSLRMAGVLERAGVASQLIVIDGARHGFETRFEKPDLDLLPDIVAFLERAWQR